MTGYSLVQLFADRPKTPVRIEQTLVSLRLLDIPHFFLPYPRILMDLYHVAKIFVSTGNGDRPVFYFVRRQGYVRSTSLSVPIKSPRSVRNL